MQLAYELLPVWAGQDDKLPTAISNLRHRSRLNLRQRMASVVRRTLTPILRPYRSRVFNADFCGLRELVDQKILTAKRAKIAKMTQRQCTSYARFSFKARLVIHEQAGLRQLVGQECPSHTGTQI